MHRISYQSLNFFSRMIMMMLMVAWTLTWTIPPSSVTAISAKADVTRSDEDTPRRSRVPIIDISSWTSVTATKGEDGSTATSNQLSKNQTSIVDQVRYACENIGFFMISGHGADDRLMNDSYDAAEHFFSLPTVQKLRHKTQNETEYPYGYEQSETLVKGRRIDDDDDGPEEEDDNDLVPDMKDLKETYSIGPNNPLSGMPPRRFIDADNSTTIQTFSKAIETYYQQMEDLAMTLLQIFGIALDFDFVDNMDRHLSALRLLHYYPLETPRNKQRIVRAGAHTDYGALTILSARDPGLEVFLRSNVDSSSDTTSSGSNDTEEPKRQWFPVPVIPNTLIINLGDLMQRWTNDKWVSTLHRVAMPSTNALEERYSMAFFVNVNGDTVIEPLQSCRTNDDDADKYYPPVTARQHLMAKHLASMSMATDSESSKSVVDSGDGDRHERSTGVQDEL